MEEKTVLFASVATGFIAFQPMSRLRVHAVDSGHRNPHTGRPFLTLFPATLLLGLQTGNKGAQERQLISTGKVRPKQEAPLHPRHHRLGLNQFGNLGLWWNNLSKTRIPGAGNPDPRLHYFFRWIPAYIGSPRIDS